MAPLHLLQLPLEIRQNIYSHLLPPRPTSHPFPNVGITSVSHQPPTSRMLNIHPQLTDEVLDFFYSISTWKLIFSHAFNFFRVDPHLRGLERCAALGRMRRVEVVFYCDVLLVKGYGLGRLPLEEEVRRKADRAVDVLLSASSLRTVVVSWIDTTATGFGGLEQMSQVLAPLQRLRDRVAFVVGRVIMGNSLETPDSESERTAFGRALREILAAGDKATDPDILRSADNTTHTLKDTGICAKSDPHSEPAQLRLLAFDPRQDRHARSLSDPTATESTRSAVGSLSESNQCTALSGSTGWA